ncbi:MAG: germination protein YpeB [Oscillospiraceae bacterium]|nr:germination protein YpeB [Oscillospiraceae bacterium]
MDRYDYIPEDKNYQDYKNYEDYKNYRNYQREEISYFNRRNIRILSFAIAVMLVGLGFFLTGLNQKKVLERENTAVYSRAFSELSNYICSINASLEKMLYITSPEQMVAVSTDLFRQAGFAQSDLGQLPLQNTDINNMQIFFAQTGDYVYSLAQQAVKNNSAALKSEDTDNINTLLSYSNKLAEQLVSMQDGINKANRSGAVLGIIQSGLDSGNVPKLSDSGNSNNFADVEQIFEDYPKLIYDGPFSAGITDKAYKMLDGKKEINTVEARSVAADFCGVPETRLKNKGMTNSNASTYNFEYDNKFIQVTARGGYILNYIVDRKIADQLMSDEDALKAAENFLKDTAWNIGSDAELRETYYASENGVMTINFAAVQDDIVLYPDLIKVGVALDNCEIVLYEASGYLQNHTARNLSINIVTREQAAKAVLPSLKINAVDLAVIQIDYDSGEHEALCYEFKCANDDNDDNKEYIVYVDAATGKQEETLVLIDTGRGKLVM